MSVRKLLSDTRKLAKAHDVKIRLIKRKRVLVPGETCASNGYFGHDDKVLAVAVNKPQEDWLPIFVHESCHLDQWVEDEYLFQKWNVGYTMFFEWLEGKRELEKNVLLQCYQDIIDCEEDCEKRTIRKMIAYELDVDIKWYRKMAITYLYSYSYILQVREWKTGIYKNNKLTDAAPNKFPDKYLPIPYELNKAFREFYTS